MNPTFADKTESDQNRQSANSQRLQHALLSPTGGVVGLVDELISICAENALELDWQADCCRARWPGNDQEEQIPTPGRKSVFRAILARIAALCNESRPNSVSPYGGTGELSVAANPKAVLR